jgi:hypothetical protein
MKILIAIALSLFASLATAADVVATLTLNHAGKPKMEQTTKLYDLTADQVADLQKSGVKQLDAAVKAQDKGGAYSITWKWNDQPALETPGMQWGAVNAVLHQGTKWLDSHVLKAK